MILFLTTADTEILAADQARRRLPASFPQVVGLNPTRLPDPATVRDRVADARLVLIRLLGGRRAWPEGFEAVRVTCLEKGIPLLAFGGEAEPDAELTAASTAPGALVAEAFEYLRHGGVENTEQLLRFTADTLLYTGHGFEPPTPLPDFGPYRDELWALRDPARPAVGLVFYRTHWMSGNTAFVDCLVDAIQEAGGDPLPVFAYTLRPAADGRIEVLDLLHGKIDVLVCTVLASGGSNASDALRSSGTGRPDEWLDWQVPALESLDVPVLQAVCATTRRVAWEQSDGGLTPLDAAMQVAIPEFDGRIIGVPVSFKEPIGDDGEVLGYAPDAERARRLAQIATRLARLRRLPNARKRIGILLSSYPTRHARIGNAVGLDTPASAVRLLAALREAGYTVEGVPESSDGLVHALIAAGGYDTEFLTDAQLDRAEARIDVRRYAEWFETLPEPLREGVRRHWGDPPGDLYVSGDEIVLAGLSFGNVFVGIQPPRGFGENPIAIYHDPDLPPSHHYLAAYRWLDEELGADALVHLGKHGTLEWLPGKALGLGAACAPDACLGSMPLVYPFICNDPGEGTQAKRRAHALIIDHLIPPMMRAETYDDLARLEQLLDDHAQVSTLDPAKLPEVEARIWELVTRTELHHDLGTAEGADEPPERFDAFLLDLDGYLCEIKDVRIRDGLHVLGQPPTGEQRIGLLGALMRLGAGEVPGLRVAVACRFGLDEAALTAAPGAPAEACDALTERFGGPAARAGDLVDRLEDASRALLHELDEHGWRPEMVPEVCQDVLGAPDPGVVAALTFAAREVIPRLEGTTDEIGNLLAALDGRFVPAGPSGSPTRGLVNVLPTGRNFYSVDPKALPSPLAWQTGQRLADDLVRRYLDEEGVSPETVGLVVWGTSAMRTQGDDIAEVFALLGVRPTWDEGSRRLMGLEVIPVPELGRPRIDVTVRISGFFRDAFPNLVALIDEAVERVAALDEADEENFVAKHVRAERASGQPEREATIRIFGSKPGAYGAGLLPLIDARNWRGDTDLARVYEVWGGYAYGRGLDGVEAPGAMRRNLGRVRVAVKNVDTREHDLLDSDDYFQFHGGMVAAIRSITGAEPRAYIADSSDPSAVRTRGLAEEVRRVFRARVANPRWIASMARHGYKGAFELAATVDYLFGYDATAGAADDWMYAEVARRYALDPETRAFFEQSNPWALRAITERLFEAADRGLWENPDPELLTQLRSSYLEVEAELEADPPGGDR